MELILVKINSLEWEYMWNWLKEHPLNAGLEQPDVALNDNEGWQYMGSYKHNEKVVHTFRHRKHPLTQRLEEVSVHGSGKLNETEIQKKYRL